MPCPVAHGEGRFAGRRHGAPGVVGTVGPPEKSQRALVEGLDAETERLDSQPPPGLGVLEAHVLGVRFQVEARVRCQAEVLAERVEDLLERRFGQQRRRAAAEVDRIKSRPG